MCAKDNMVNKIFARYYIFTSEIFLQSIHDSDTKIVDYCAPFKLFYLLFCTMNPNMHTKNCMSIL